MEKADSVDNNKNVNKGVTSIDINYDNVHNDTLSIWSENDDMERDDVFNLSKSIQLLHLEIDTQDLSSMKNQLE